MVPRLPRSLRPGKSRDTWQGQERWVPSPQSCSGEEKALRMALAASLKLRPVPPFFFTYISNFISKWSSLQVWEQWTKKRLSVAARLCGPRAPSAAAFPGQGVRVGRTRLHLLQRRRPIGNPMEMKRRSWPSGVELLRSLEMLEVQGSLDSSECAALEQLKRLLNKATINLWHLIAQELMLHKEVTIE